MSVVNQVASRLAPIVPVFRRGRFVAQVTCAECGGIDEWTAASMPEPSVVRKKTEAKGWLLGRTATCAACQADRKKEKAMTNVTSIKTEQPSSSDAKAAERLFVRVMEDEAYDQTALRYKSGYSDIRMSKDLGLAEKHIATLRDRFFGPAGEPDEVTTIRLAIDGLTSELGKLRSRFDSMCVKNGFKQ